MRPADLEQYVHRELRRLPAPSAPATLLPRVMAAVQAWSLRPWYARAWFTWPVGLQVLSVAGLVAFIVSAVALAPAAEAVAAAAFAGRATGLESLIASAAGRVGTAVAAARVMWRALAAPLLPYVFVVVMMMCAACAAFGAALSRVALGTRSEA